MSENTVATTPNTTEQTGKTGRNKKPKTLEELQKAKEEKQAQIQKLKEESATLGRKIGAKTRIQRKEAERAERAKRRKERTHRLCVIGGIIESAGACEISNFDAFKDWAFRFGYKIRGTQGLPEETPAPAQRAEFDAQQAEIDKPE